MSNKSPVPARRDGLFYVSPRHRKHDRFGLYGRKTPGKGPFRFLVTVLDRRQALKDARQMHDLAVAHAKPMEIAVKGARTGYGLPLLFRTVDDLVDEG